jgi:ionotropic glutamate receptor
VIWVLEHRINNEFRGPLGQQLGTIFWFSFSTLVFAQSKLSTTLLTIFFFIQFHDNQ